MVADTSAPAGTFGNGGIYRTLTDAIRCMYSGVEEFGRREALAGFMSRDAGSNPAPLLPP